MALLDFGFILARHNYALLQIHFHLLQSILSLLQQTRNIFVLLLQSIDFLVKLQNHILKTFTVLILFVYL